MKFTFVFLVLISPLIMAENLAVSVDSGAGSAPLAAETPFSMLPLSQQSNATGVVYKSCEVGTRTSDGLVWVNAVLRSGDGHISGAGGSLNSADFPLTKGWRRTEIQDFGNGLRIHIQTSYDGAILKFVHKSRAFNVYSEFTVDPVGKNITRAHLWATDHNGKEVHRYVCGDDLTS